MIRPHVFLSLAAVAILSACGADNGDRPVHSASGNVGAGTAIGGVSGEATGTAGNPCNLGIGDPFWSEHGGYEAYQQRCGHAPH